MSMMVTESDHREGSGSGAVRRGRVRVRVGGSEPEGEVGRGDWHQCISGIPPSLVPCDLMTRILPLEQGEMIRKQLGTRDR